jgi:hypothetical protein
MSDKPEPGDLYVFAEPADVGVEWLVVRYHPGETGDILMVPADDCPFFGPSDCAVPYEVMKRDMTIRCGQSDWFPVSVCAKGVRVGSMPSYAMVTVRAYLAALARGDSLGPLLHDDYDPDYDEWIEDVARARRVLLATTTQEQP